jgi:uncharacterized membrane protein
MTNGKQGMKPIWYFVGWVLFLTGAVVIIAGIATYGSPDVQIPQIAGLHTALWWGALMVIAGAIYIFTNRNATIE